MFKLTRLREMTCVIAIVFMPLFFISTDVFGVNTDKQSNYVLNVKGNLISLDAKNAALRTILEDIGRQMAIVVKANISPEEKVTDRFDNLELHEAIKRLSTNYVYLMDSKKDKGGVTKIVVLPKGTEMDFSQSTKEQTVSKPVTKTHTKTELFKAQKQAKNEHPKSELLKAEEHAKKEKAKPVSFKFEFDPSEYIKNKKQKFRSDPNNY